MMAGEGLTEDYRCGYCYQEFNSMTDPRELPCHHIFCLTCMKADYRQNSDFNCITCQQVCQVKNLDDLPPVKLDVEVSSVPTSLTCDCMDCDGQLAVCFCMECKDKICDIHVQTHNSHFGKKHRTIAISVYESSPQQYKKVRCDSHSEEIVLACEKCTNLACVKCDLYSGLCQGLLTSSHKFGSIDKFTEEITAHFSKLMKAANEKLAEICKVDKEIWRMLDEQEKKCEERIKLVETITQEQIQKSKEQCEDMKERIRDYLHRLTNQVEQYNTELMDKKEKLEESRTKVHRWLRESHVTDKIQQKHQMTEELARNTTTNLHRITTHPPAVISKEDCEREISTCLITLPTSLKLKSTLNTGSHTVRSTSYCPNGDLLIGSSGGLMLKTERSLLVETFGPAVSTSIPVVKHNVHYIIHKVDNSRYHMVMLFPHSADGLTQFEFASTDVVPFLAVSDEYIVATSPGSCQVHIYNLVSKQLKTLTVNPPLWVVYFLPSGELLATAGEDELRNCSSYTNPGKPYNGVNLLTKYRIGDGKLLKVWRCEDLPYACGVCTDSDGLIYVSTFRKNTLYIISPHGGKLQQLSYGGSPITSGQISIWRDTLAVPDWDNPRIHLYRINR